MNKLLLTGFDPFGGEAINPSWQAACLVPEQIGDTKVSKLLVPTSFARGAAVLQTSLLREQPDAVLCLGQAGGRSALTPERVAINWDDARIPDNDGAQPIDVPIVPEGPAAYFTTLPIKAMAEAIRAVGVPAGISNSAGTFVCNHLMYRLLHTLATECPGVRGGFLHLPYAPAQVAGKPGQPCLAVEEAAKGITAAIRAIFCAANIGYGRHTCEGSLC